MKHSNSEKILQELYENPTKSFSLRELARKTKLNPNTVLNLLTELKKEKIIKKNKFPHFSEIKLNLENDKVIGKKKLFNLRQIYDSEIIEFLKEKYNPEYISIMGSYSKGEDVETSDIDIVVKTEAEKNIDLRKFEKKLKRKIHLLELQQKRYSEEFFNNLINGIILYGVITNERL